MSPKTFLNSDDIVSPLKRKSSPLLFDREMQKRLKLDPMPAKTDSTIDQYQARVHTLLPDDRNKLSVHIHSDDMKDQIEKLKVLFCSLLDLEFLLTS